jgi:ribonucleoside-diphosphate reductase alpha chain
VTPYNCYVSGTIPDSFVDRDNPERSSIAHRAEQAAATMRMGGGIGYSFGTLRPRGAMIQKLRSRSTGAVSFMQIYNSVGLCTSSTDHRRGAQMGVLPIWHPDIKEFVHAKRNEGALTGFNISVGITDDFMVALDNNVPYDLRFGGKVYDTVDPRELWHEVMQSTWDWAEPGVLFLDTINRMNNLWYCETIAATNPCGEQPLPPFGACLLGSFNLVKYLVPGNGVYTFDWDQFIADIPPVVRAMDNIVDRATYPLPQQRQEALSKRRMGLGVTGLANTLEAMGFPYGSEQFLRMEMLILRTLKNESYRASAYLAAEKGAFPLYDKERYCSGEFIKTLDLDVQELIARFGIRNSHLTSIAPCGTISLAADNVSSAIEPVFAFETERQVRSFGDDYVTETTYDYGYSKLGVRGKKTSEVTVDEHLAVLLTAQQEVDSACSKTCNVGDDVTFEQFKDVYLRAYYGGAKGCTTFRLSGKRMGIMTEKKEETGEEGLTCSISADGRRSCE